jgi:hypothetical protein
MCPIFFGWKVRSFEESGMSHECQGDGTIGIRCVQENPWVAVAAGTAIAVALVYVAFAGRNNGND